MRELKFRAWVLNYETDEYNMYHWCNHFFSDASPVSGYSDYFPDGDYVDVILMQYTGLKDYTDKEIYEGDIVKFQGDLLQRIIVVEWQSELKYSMGTEYQYPYFGWVGRYPGRERDRSDDLARLIDSDKFHRFDVIGNIYENPELAKR